VAALAAAVATAVAVGRLPVGVAVKADIKEVATAAIFCSRSIRGSRSRRRKIRSRCSRRRKGNFGFHAKAANNQRERDGSCLMDDKVESALGGGISVLDEVLDELCRSLTLVIAASLENAILYMHSWVSRVETSID
jgi:hypothetical protein